MFRQDIREKPVLYKEILKAISKRELLEDLYFCACRKDYLLACIAWQVTCFAFGWLLGQPLTTQQSVTFCIVQWLCHLEQVAQDYYAVA